jgi:hypothetical protein
MVAQSTPQGLIAFFPFDRHIFIKPCHSRYPRRCILFQHGPQPQRKQSQQNSVAQAPRLWPRSCSTAALGGVSPIAPPA